MALWGFSKKKKAAKADEASNTVNNDEAVETTGVTEAADVAENKSSDDPSAETNEAQEGSLIPAVPGDTSMPGETGPFDGDSVDINEFDFGDFSSGLLDLGSVKLAVPKDSQVQVEMGEKGPKMLHLVTHYGRLTPIAFAAPSSAGQWEEAADEIAESMAQSGAEVRFEQGPWGREVVGENKQAVTRVIGAEKPRWMLRVTLAGPAQRAEQLAELAREVIARTFVYRGDKPILAGNSLPVTMPSSLMQQIQQTMQQRQAQSQQQSPRVDEAKQALRNAAGEPTSNDQGAASPDSTHPVTPDSTEEQR